MKPRISRSSSKVPIIIPRTVTFSLTGSFIFFSINQLIRFLIKSAFSVSSTLPRTSSFNSLCINPWLSCIILLDMVDSLLGYFMVATTLFYQIAIKHIYFSKLNLRNILYVILIIHKSSLKLSLIKHRHLHHSLRRFLW